MKRYFVVMLFAALASSAEAAVPLWAACMAAMCGGWAAVGMPIGCGWGLWQCGALVACFDDDTTVIGHDGHVLGVADVEAGDMVKTLDEDGKEAWTEVTDIHHINGASAGIKIEARGQDGKLRNVAVSSSHGLIRMGDDGAEVVPARGIRPGDPLKVDSDKDGTFATVLSTTAYEMPSRTVLYTREGTVLADGIHAATSCGHGNSLRMQDYFIKLQEQAEQQECAQEIFDDISSLIDNIAMDGYVGKADIFEYVVRSCIGENVTQILLDMVGNYGHVPEALKKDDASLLNLVAIGEGYPAMYASTLLNPYLCETCYESKHVSELLGTKE